ncbi:MAG: CarD family transcriptional regulator, partial [Sarcina sp.]
NKPIIIVTHNDMEARNLYEDLSFYNTDVYYFPTKEVVFYNIDAISGDLRWARLKVIREMINSRKKIIVTSIEAFASIYTPLELYKKHTLEIKVGDTLELSSLSQKLIECGYERMEVVEGKGEFSLRGGIIDIYPPNSNLPFRIDLFGDEIDSIKTFNIESQRSIEKVTSMEIFPAKEIILNDEVVTEAIEKINNELSEFEEGKYDNKEIFNRIKDVITTNIELLKEQGNFETMDSYMPFFFPEPSTLFDYVKDFIIIVDDAQRCKGKLESTLFEFKENYEAFLERGNILPSQGNLMLNLETILGSFQGKEIIVLNPFNKSESFLPSYLTIDFNQITLNNYQGQLDLLIEEIKEKKSNGFKTLILSGSRPRGERLVNTLRERGIESVYRDNVEDILDGEVVITFGNQLKGFQYSDLKLCLISDKEVFGEAKRKAPKKKVKQKGVAKIRSFGELKPGDYVVHVNSGIGVYKGIKQIEVNAHKRDYLDIEYSKGDKLYVPVEQLDLV